ncbi:hypothetical protein [Acetonema longum]|uniref:Uncharacterized protein n=1 Tax=Acetonema longum DSM 6540 TaxID=1009370 RepID=F7NDV1_9FIRM|nr:hypothetical protein [Acetonema longum]EGO65766.1 hypothetical protein ALO_01045 [Acetonema longum DSM 6540]
MENIRELVRQWAYLDSLEPDMAGFSLTKPDCMTGSQYLIFSYSCQSRRLAFSALYDEATKDFLVKISIGLLEYVDINFICQDLAQFEAILRQRLQSQLASMAGLEPQTLGHVFGAKKITEWDYSGCLPATAAGFDLFVNPARPVRWINGAYLIVDYSDFASDSNLTIMYNIYRDDFYGEKRIRCTPAVISTFDAKEIAELQEKISTHLLPTLEEMRAEIHETDHH